MEQLINIQSARKIERKIKRAQKAEKRIAREIRKLDRKMDRRCMGIAKEIGFLVTRLKATQEKIVRLENAAVEVAK
jgi:hypothetical protein